MSPKKILAILPIWFMEIWIFSVSAYMDRNPRPGVPMATSGNNLYMAWPNNDTWHFNVFFAKSTDGGRTLKTIIISAPNKGHRIDFNTEIFATGSNVYV